ncbi:PIG-L deacetylase family protein [Acidisoma sp. C75]
MMQTECRTISRPVTAEEAFRGKHLLVVTARPDAEMLPARHPLLASGRITLLPLSGDEPERRASPQAGLPAEGASLGFPAGRLSFAIPAATARLAEALRQIAPDIVLTHAYEGCDADRDATALIVHAAAARLASGGRGGRKPALWAAAADRGRPPAPLAAPPIFSAIPQPLRMLPRHDGRRELAEAWSRLAGAALQELAMPRGAGPAQRHLLPAVLAYRAARRWISLRHGLRRATCRLGQGVPHLGAARLLFLASRCQGWEK